MDAKRKKPKARKKAYSGSFWSFPLIHLSVCAEVIWLPRNLIGELDPIPVQSVALQISKVFFWLLLFLLLFLWRLWLLILI